MRCRGEIFGKRLLGNGEYRQLAASSGCFRWDTKLQAGDSIISVQQIADGQYLWINRRNPSKADLSRVDLARIDAAERALPAAMPGPAPQPIALATGGGLPRLVRNLDRAFRFSRLTETQLGDTRVFTVRGNWTPVLLATIAPEQQAAITNGRPLNWAAIPEQVPDHVVIALGRADYFPYRIEFRRTDGEHYKVLLMAELYDVQCNVPISQTLFNYQPGKVPVTDITDQFVGTLLRP